MFGIAERRRERYVEEAAKRSSIRQAVSEILASTDSLRLTVDGREVSGNRDYLSIAIETDYGREYILYTYENLLRRYGDHFKTPQVTINGTGRITPFVEAMGLDFSRSYTAGYESFCLHFDSPQELADWLDTYEARYARLSHAWVTFRMN